MGCSVALNNWRIVVMVIRRRLIALSSLAAFLMSVMLSAQSAPPRKLTKAEEKERDAIYALLSSGATQNDLGVTWVREDMLKSSQNQEYVPFVLSLDPSKAQAKQLSIYWRVVSTSTPAPAAAPANAKGGTNKPAPQVYAFEQMNTATVTPVDGVIRLSRAFQVLAGNYDVYVVVKEPTPEKPAKNAPPVKA